MNRVGVAMGAKLFEFQTAGCVATVFGSRVPRHSCRSLIEIGATLCTFERNNNPSALLASHNVIQFTDQ